MKAFEVNEKGSFLTLDKAKSLVGKRILATSPEYKGNQCTVADVTVLGIDSAWNLAAEKKVDGDFTHLQDYWASYMTPAQIDLQKRKKILLTDQGEMFFCITHPAHLTEEEREELIFQGSDLDRPVKFVVKKAKVRMTKKGNYSKVGLNKNELASLWVARKEINFDPEVQQDEKGFINVNYDDEKNELFFVAIITGWEPKHLNVEYIWSI